MPALHALGVQHYSPPPENLPFFIGVTGPRLIHHFLGPPNLPLYMASRSNLPFSRIHSHYRQNWHAVPTGCLRCVHCGLKCWKLWRQYQLLNFRLTIVRNIMFFLFWFWLIFFITYSLHVAVIFYFILFLSSTLNCNNYIFRWLLMTVWLHLISVCRQDFHIPPVIMSNQICRHYLASLLDSHV